MNLSVGMQQIYASLFMAISEKSNIFLWLAISKRIELQLPDWRHLQGISHQITRKKTLPFDFELS